MLKRLNDSRVQQASDDVGVMRKAQMGSGERGDKIRTYRFQDDIAKDHRTNRQASVNSVMLGNFQLLWS